MFALTAIDTVHADSVEVGDHVEVDGIFGKVLDIDDQGDIIVLTLNNDSDGENEDYPLFVNDLVTILG